MWKRSRRTRHSKPKTSLFPPSPGWLSRSSTIPLPARDWIHTTRPEPHFTSIPKATGAQPRSRDFEPSKASNFPLSPPAIVGGGFPDRECSPSLWFFSAFEFGGESRKAADLHVPAIPGEVYDG